jgi:hypothetical protein
MKQARTRALALATVAAIAAWTSTAAANPQVEASTETSWEFGIGARIGGYGFREEVDGAVSWEDCRMNGTGVFLTLDFTEHFFGEAGFDLYHATGPSIAAGMDRLSFHNQYALGARFLPDFFISPYVQVGGGPEFTRIEMDGASKTMVVPSGFMGIGGELNLGSLKLGMNIRALMMIHPEHDHYEVSYDRPLGAYGGHGHSLSNGGEGTVETDWEVAGQMHFFARYAF